MFERPEFDANGKKVLCEINGKNADMHMNIYVKKMKKGETLEIYDDKNETAVLLLQGKVTFAFDGKAESGERANPFEKKPYALHVAKNSKIAVTCDEDAEIIVEQTDNDNVFPAEFYTPENCLYQEFGKGQWNGTGHRIVSTMFDYDNAPKSNLVLGEVFTQPGRWSSYPPHHHPQPEVYYYRFDKPQGFGACYLGDDVFKSTDGSYCCIEPGKDHEQAAAPCYEMYYVWMIRHIDGDPWYKTTRIVGEDHQWILNAK
jgi:5-deoxy-glucuronate isomerase